MKWSLPVLIAVCTSLGLRAHPGPEPAGFAEPEPGGAHHAIGEIYDEERTVVLSGEVESFLFGNPHSLLHVRVPDGGGRVRTWAVEWRAADRLSRAGLTGEALAPGDAVTLCGHPGRDPAAYRLYLLNVARRAAGSPPSADTRAALCERETRPEVADLPARRRSAR